MNKPLVVIDIPNGKAMAQIAKHLEYSTETIEQFKGLNPDNFPTYVQERNPKNDASWNIFFWGSNLAWVPEYKYRIVDYKEYIKEHRLKPKQYTKREIQQWMNEQMAAVKESFEQHFPEESFKRFVLIFLRKVGL